MRIRIAAIIAALLLVTGLAYAQTNDGRPGGSDHAVIACIATGKNLIAGKYPAPDTKLECRDSKGKTTDYSTLQTLAELGWYIEAIADGKVFYLSNKLLPY